MLKHLVLLLALVSCQAFGADCSWNEPGRDPYTGSKSSAIYHFDHMRYDVRLRLMWMVKNKPPTDLVSIGRDSIRGDQDYSYSGLNGMHFGRGHQCESVKRDRWAADHVEPAKAWCYERWCVVIPDVCGNVAWTVRDVLPAALLRKPAQKLPEPSSLWVALAAILAAWSIGARTDRG